MKNKLLKKLIVLPVFLLFGSVIYAQIVTGVVSDANGPLPGVNILVKGTNTGTQTDFDGNYSFDVGSSEAVLVFSYVGYKTQEISVAGQSNIDVSLEEDAAQLDEVVIMGYAAQTRGDITGSVSSVDMDEALKAPVVNAAEALQGRVTGVTVVNTGSPGSAPRISIRGVGSNGNTNPLYIIDGVQTDDVNALNNLNPADIDQMNVLKDGAAAIYGARASNGVVVITTKSGGYNMDKAKVSLDIYTGFSQIGEEPGVLNAQQHAEMIWQSYLNDGITPTHGQYGSGATPVVPTTIQGYRRVVSYDPIVFSAPGEFTASVNPGGTDWLDAITRNAATQNVSMSIQNGNEHGKYFMSVGFLNRDGIMNHTGFKKATTRLNSEFKIGEKLRIGQHMNLSYSNTKVGDGEAIENSFRITPLLPVKDDHGNYTGVAGTDLSNTRNPAAQLYRSRNNFNRRFAVLGDVYLTYDILDELTFKTTLAGEFGTYDGRFFTALDPEHGEPISSSTLAEVDQTYYNWVWSNTLNYNKSFGDHSINAVVGVEALKNNGRGKRVSRTGYLFETPDFYTLSNGSGAANVDWTFDGWDSLWSIFGTVNYSYQDKYYATVTLRRDESSRFLGENKSDTFPSFSGGWVLSEEDFYNDDSFINRIKLRGSWGELGNQNVPTGLRTSNVNSLSDATANYSFDGSSITSGALLSSIGNPNLQWETSVSKNFGIDLSMLDSKLNVSLEYYDISSDGLISPNAATNPSTGADANPPIENIGTISNKGIDFSIGYSDTTESGFYYSVNANISHYKNEVSNFNAPVFGRGDIRNGAVTYTENGEEISYFYGRNVIGLDNDGRFMYEDVNGDGSVNDEDRTKLGSPHPDFTYGINANFAYKGFDAQLFFTGSQGNDVYNYNKVFSDFGLFFQGNRSTRVLNAWTPSNTNTSVPALTTSYPLEEASANSYFVEDGSYLKLKNVQIGYTFSDSLAEKIGMDSLRLYVQATNLFTITNYSGFDPEVVSYDNLSLGIDSRLYPISKVFTLGANIKF